MPSLLRLTALLLAATWAGVLNPSHGAEPQIRSHSPARPLLAASDRPLAPGVALYVDPVRGQDAQDGSADKPWRTINNALKRVQPGDTLYLRGGVYYENVYCAVAGRQDAPITLRSYPGELAVIDGGLKAKYPAGWEASSIVADPCFVQFDTSPDALVDFRLQKNSPAVQAGVVLPREWNDPLRLPGDAPPDIGALPLASDNPRFGREGAVRFPIRGTGKMP